MTPFPDIDDIPDGFRSVQFTSEDIDFTLENQEGIAAWIEEVIEREGCELSYISYIFCSDEYLHKINVEHLDHDTFTDIITFPYGEYPEIESDIFISVERVKENAEKFTVTFEKELLRVIIHGVLHLCGHGDKTEKEAKNMRKKEDEALSLYDSHR